MSEMIEDDLEAFMREPMLASVATVRPDGSPHVVPAWFEWDGNRCTSRPRPTLARLETCDTIPGCRS